MKLKKEVIEGFAKGTFPNVEQSRMRRGVRNITLHQLEVCDFDKAINLLMFYNKKTAVKEFTLLKEEYCSGANMDYRYFNPANFVEHLKEVLTKRMSDIEERNALKRVKETWDLESITQFEENFNNVVSAITSQKDLIEGIEKMKSKLDIREAKSKEVLDWIKKEVEENGDSLDKITPNDFADILHIIEFYEEQEKAVGHTWY